MNDTREPQQNPYMHLIEEAIKRANFLNSERRDKETQNKAIESWEQSQARFLKLANQMAMDEYGKKFEELEMHEASGIMHTLVKGLRRERGTMSPHEKDQAFIRVARITGKLRQEKPTDEPQQ